MSRIQGPVYRDVLGRRFPAMTLLGARGLFDADGGWMIEIQTVAVLA
jgi:hypothetical protein